MNIDEFGLTLGAPLAAVVLEISHQFLALGVDRDDRLISAEEVHRLVVDVTKLCVAVARDGDHQPIHIEKTDANFSIEWKGNYRIEGAAFIFVDRNTRGTRAILGYPTQKLTHLARGR